MRCYVDNEVSDALFLIGLRTLSRFTLAINMLPHEHVPNTKPIYCPWCGTRCWDLSPSVHKPGCEVVRMLRRAERGRIAK